MTPASVPALPALPLKAMHPGLSPAWWPPAPGWWLVLLVVVLLAGGVVCWLHGKRKRTNVLMHYFDHALAQAITPAAQVAAMSELLRRAARSVDPLADRLAGLAWLQFLDAGLPHPVFTSNQGTSDIGATLLEGAFRPQVEVHAVDALRQHARQRYVLWMRGI